MLMAERIQTIQEKIRGVAAGRKVEILAATKAQPADRVEELVKAGIHHLGVNYAQEGEQLKQQLKHLSCVWHFIGHIQSRKVKYLPPYTYVQSLDRIEIAQGLEKILSLQNKKIKCLVEVNIGQEVQKSGVALNQLESFLEKLSAFKFVEVSGLMAMPPLEADEKSRRGYFAQLRQRYEEFGKFLPFEFLSMGTSDDYLLAIAEGSNLVRLGTVLFGPRLKGKQQV